MPETRWTPGPWEAEPNTCTDGPHVPGSYKVHHAGTRQWVASEVTARDARLIAAAPALLNALQNLLAYADRYSDEMAKIGRGAEQLGAMADSVSVSGMARAAIASAINNPSPKASV